MFKIVRVSWNSILNKLVKILEIYDVLKIVSKLNLWIDFARKKFIWKC